MSKSEQTQTEIAILAATQNKGGSSSTTQDELAAILKRKLEREMNEEDEVKRQAEKARLASVQAAKFAAEQRTMAQAQCPHMKPNFTPATGGQKDHKGNYHYICQYCGKEYGNELPAHLRISSDMVGGPQ